jgi:two-component system response regulator FixJ
MRIPVGSMKSATTPICILDDDASVLRSIARLLKSGGFPAHTFERGVDFLAYARAHDVKLAILDVHMPEIDGLQVQTELRRVSPATGVVLMTGCDEAQLRVAALDGGALAFLLKPFDDEAFLDLVHRTLAAKMNGVDTFSHNHP